MVGAAISDNVIQDCGVRDFVYNNSGKNGEGIYVGTSSTQVTCVCDGWCVDRLFALEKLASLSQPSMLMLVVMVVPDIGDGVGSVGDGSDGVGCGVL